MSSIATAVSGRKADRARLSVRIFKCIAYLSCALVAYWFKSTAEYVSGAVSGVMILFSAFELLDVLRVFVSKPIQLSQKQSSLLGATGLDFEVKKTSGIKPKPKMPDLDTSLASCLLNKSIDSPKVTPGSKKTNSQSPHLLRHRITSSGSRQNQSITEGHELDEYLNSFNESGNNDSLLAFEQPRATQWTAPISRQDNKYQFQLSRSPPKNRTTEKGGDVDTGVKGGDAFAKLGVSADDQARWAINIRKYLWSTIIHPLTKQIDHVNNQLKASLPDVQIGKTSISDLKAVSNVAIQNEIRILLPYLEATTNHGYLIKRLKTLDQYGYLSSYVWNGGEAYAGKEWSATELPTDSKILVHLLSCWLDTHLPPDPAAGPDARAFSERYILKATDIDKKGLTTPKPLPSIVPFALIEKSSSPPEYYIQSRVPLQNESLHHLPPGRSNPLGAVLLLFYLLNRENHGMVGGVALGGAGLNILSVFD